LLGFRMEVIIKPRYEDMGDPYCIVVKPDGVSGWVSALLSLTLINHSRNNPERIIGCWVELRRRHLLFLHRTITLISVLTSSPNDYRLNYPIKDIYLEPTSKPQTMTIQIGGDFTCDKMPKRSELVLVFKMVGLLREYRKKLCNIRHKHIA